MSGDISPEEQQARWLEEGKAVVKQQAFLMFSSLPLHPLCILCSHIMHPYSRAHILVHTHLFVCLCVGMVVTGPLVCFCLHPMLHLPHVKNRHKHL